MNANDKTPLAIQPDSGIRLNLSNYYRIRTWQGGGEFWEHNNQQLIRDALGQFLPRATVDASDHVLFQHFESGREICSLSQPVSATNSLPKQQIDQLRAAVIAFKAKTQDPHCDPEARKLIDCFRLPDPQKDPELYRIYGTGKNKRLIVLWGAEKEVDSAITPLQAINMVHTEPDRAGKGNVKSVLVAGALILMTLLGLFLWQSNKEKNLADGGENSGSGAPLPLEKNVNGGESSMPFVASGDKDGQFDTTPGAGTNENEAQSGITGGRPKDDMPITGVNGASAPKKPSQLAADNDEAPGSNAKTYDASKNLPSNDPKTSKLEGSDNKDMGSKNNKEGEPVSSERSAVTDAAKPTTNGKEELNTMDQSTTPVQDKNSEGIAGAKGDELPAKKNQPTNATDELQPKPETTTPNDKNAPKPGTTTTAEMSETKIQIKETTPFDSSGKPSAQQGLPGTINAGKLEIQADVGEVPENGKVEVILGLVARDEDLKEIEMDRATWLLDGRAIQGQDGKPINDTNLSRWMPVGKHALSVIGKTKEGREVRGEAVIDVRIKQQPKPEVDIQNSPTTKNK